MTQVAESLDLYLEELDRAGAADTRQAPEWVRRARQHARDRFQALGFPTTSDEEWRFTSVAPIVDADGVTIGDSGLSGWSTGRLMQRSNALFSTSCLAMASCNCMRGSKAVSEEVRGRT